MSGGTTGTPKGVMITHRNLVTNVRSMIEVVPIRPTYRLLSLLPVRREQVAAAEDLAFIRPVRMHARQDLHEGGLACAVLTEEGHDLSRLDADGQAVLLGRERAGRVGGERAGRADSR